MLDFANLVRRSQDEGWALVVLNPALDLSTSEGRLVANILVSLAEFERELIAARIREGLAEAKRRGKRLGRTQRVSDEIARRIVRERELGASLHEIARGLNRDEIPTVRGGAEWYAATIRGVISAHEDARAA
jgi:DNA invertase Pin-like site-specific DNA recombinase